MKKSKHENRAYRLIANLMIVGSAIKEIIQQKVPSPVEKCWVESGFCAYLVLRYDDPENPQLEAMNSV